MKLKLFIVVTCISILGSYIIPLGIYLLPANPLTVTIRPKIKKIINGFAYQDWHLFAPNPSKNVIKMYVRCKDKEKWTDWFNVIETLQKAHKKNIFSTKGLYYRHYNHMVISFRAGYRFTNTRILKKTKHFNKIKKLMDRFAGDLCLHKMQTSSVTVEFRIFDFYPKQYSKRNSEKVIQTYSSKTFGPYSYTNDLNIHKQE